MLRMPKPSSILSVIGLNGLTMGREERFGFGRNWKNFVEKNLSDEHVQLSKDWLLEFLGLPDLRGRSMLDVGCGSGLHAYAAIKAGVERVVAFDYDPKSVEASRLSHAHAGNPPNWEIRHGSVLDESFMRSLGTFDIVYSWGVLHHTGDVWRAIRNAAVPVRQGGLFYIALYSSDVQKPPYTAEFWLDVKQQYLKSSWFGRRRWEWWYVYNLMLGRDLRRLPEFFQRRATHRRDRGMDLMTDIRDWLGGWPMEFCKDDDVKRFCQEELALDLVNINAGRDANTEFLFRRST